MALHLNPARFIAFHPLRFPPLRLPLSQTLRPPPSRRLGFSLRGLCSGGGSAAGGRVMEAPFTVKERIDLTKKEEKIFQRLLDVIRHFKLETQLRVAGGWVRDKIVVLLRWVWLFEACYVEFKVFPTDLYRPIWVVYTGPPDYWYMGRPLSGGTTKINRRRSIEGEKWKKMKKRKRRKNTSRRPHPRAVAARGSPVSRCRPCSRFFSHARRKIVVMSPIYFISALV
ncbi:hypothetical protein GW17_00041731 [Ensete ventricosum]|nr:hypothetical protein GW17_00041731 [Ensete ventricosum]RZS09125.1 hypothetical protein BHM03_00040177 [Ensete ventricosum]